MPLGPQHSEFIRPDAGAFRLCGNSGKFVSWLAAWARGNGELLISNYASLRPDDRAPWMLPLRKPIVDKDGQLTTRADGQRVFISEDVTGKGCATVTGIEDGKEHAFRLLCRMEMVELYVDDLLMQTYTHPLGSGRVGVVVCHAQAEFSDLRAWAMSFAEAKTDM